MRMHTCPTAPGRWVNIKELMKKPLIDPGVADDQLAAWIDSSTMAVHQFLGKLGQVGVRGGEGGCRKCVGCAGGVFWKRWGQICLLFVFIWNLIGGRGPAGPATMLQAH